MSDPTGPDDIDIDQGQEDEPPRYFDSFFQAATGGRKATGETPGRFRSMLGSLERERGSVKAAAADAGVSESTWRRWKRGDSKPRPENFDKVTRARRRALTKPERITQATGPSGGFTVCGTIIISADERDRCVNLGSELPPGRLDAATDAFLRGDDQAVEAEIQAVISEAFARAGASGAFVREPTISF